MLPFTEIKVVLKNFSIYIYTYIYIIVASFVTRKNLIRKTGVPKIDLLPMVSVSLWIIFNATTDQSA